jgi:chromosome segregation ATPase
MQSIAEQERKLRQQISLEAKSAIQNLQNNPKPYYTMADVEVLVESLKDKMVSINNSAHTEFSKKGFKSPETLESTKTMADLVSNEELTQVKEENQELKKKISEMNALEQKIDDLQILVDEKDLEITQLQNQAGKESNALEQKIDDLQILVDEKDLEITQMQNQAGKESKKTQEHIENLNRLQEAYDESNRELKKAIQDRERMEAEFETVGNALMSTRLEIEGLQQALGDKDLKIERIESEKNIIIQNLNSEVQVLSSQAETNIELKGTVERLEQEIEKLTVNHSSKIEEHDKVLAEKLQSQEKDIFGLNQQINKIAQEKDQLNERITQLEQENEDLLLDSGETSQEAIASRKELEDLQSIKNSLDAQIQDLQIDVKGKEERINTIETSRNELRETLANIKIENEKQKSTLIDLKTQIGTSDRELEEKQKDLEFLREKQKEMVHVTNESRSKQAEIERELDNYVDTVKKLQDELEEANNDRNRANKRFQSINNELQDKDSKISKLKTTEDNLQNIIEKLRSTVETLRINLAKNPKYAILFVLQDIQQATLGELAKTVAIQQIFATRLMHELESEGWVSFNEANGTVTLKKALLE